jgi:hypothetical protein
LKISEILQEGAVTDDVTNDVMDFITAYRNKNVSSIPMMGENGMMVYLQRLGHDLDKGDVMKLLSNPPFGELVKKSSPEKIELNTDFADKEPNADTLEKSRKKMDKNAEKIASKMVKAQGEV